MNTKVEIDESQPHFRLNMRIIADVLERNLKKIELYTSGDSCRLEGVRIFYDQKELRDKYVYFIHDYEVGEKLSQFEGIAFIVVGKVEVSRLPLKGPIIQVIDESGFMEIFDLVMETFDMYKRWDWRLQWAIYSVNSLDEILLASIEVLRNPMFIHDTNFFILSSPKYVPGMQIWDTDPRTGRKIVPISVINDFMVDIVYLEGMKTRQVTMYPAEQRGYRILYRNLWNEGRYEGRILVDEIQSVIQPGDYYVLEYLGKFVEMCLKNKRIVGMSMGDEIEQFLEDFLAEKIEDERQILNYLQLIGGSRFDRYLCLSIVPEQRDFQMVSSMATLGQIQAQIMYGQAIFYDNSIVVVANLSYKNSTAAETVSKLAVILRDGLLKVGISSEVNDFLQVPKAYHQARIALVFGRASGNTYWYYYFDDFMLEYIIDQASKEIPIDLLCTDALITLQKYDEQNHTELYETLLTFLKLEQNVLQTSKALFIHRSTLAYRVDRIQKITGIRLDDPKERLKLMISYYMLERGI